MKRNDISYLFTPRRQSPIAISIIWCWLFGCLLGINVDGLSKYRNPAFWLSAVSMGQNIRPYRLSKFKLSESNKISFKLERDLHPCCYPRHQGHWFYHIFRCRWLKNLMITSSIISSVRISPGCKI